MYKVTFRYTMTKQRQRMMLPEFSFYKSVRAPLSSLLNDFTVLFCFPNVAQFTRTLSLMNHAKLMYNFVFKWEQRFNVSS